MKFSFPGTKRKSVASVSKKSDKIFGVFTKTKSDAEKLDAEIEKINAQKKKDAQKILDDVNELEKISATNKALAEKVSAFLNN